MLLTDIAVEHTLVSKKDGVRQTPDGHPNSPAYGHLKLPHLN